MEEETSKAEKIPPEDYPYSRFIHKRTSPKESDREVKISTMAVQTVYSSKEGLQQGALDFRSLVPELFYQLPILQNAETQGCKTSSPTGLLDNVSRPSRRLLAYSHYTQETPISRVPLQRTSLAVQSNAFWSEYSSSDFHKANISCGKRTGGSGSLDPSIFRRPSSCGPYKGALPSSHSTYSSETSAIGFHCQRKKIQTDSETIVRMAGSALGSTVSPSSGYQGQNRGTSNWLPGGDMLENMSEGQNSESSGSCQLCRAVRHDFQIGHDNNKEHPTNVQTLTSGGQNKSSLKFQDEALQMDELLIPSTETRNPSPGPHHTYGCDAQRVGYNSGFQEVSRHVRCFNDLLNKCAGTSSNLVCCPSGESKKSGFTHTLRQSDGSQRFEERGLKVISPVVHSGNDMEEGSTNGLDHANISYKRKFQCHNRSTLKECRSLHRMVTRQRRFSEDSTVRTSPSSGFVCDEPKQQTTDICLPMSRQFGDSSGCSVDSLGEVDSSLPLPTNCTVTKGSSKVGTYSLRESDLNHTRYTHETLVHETVASQHTFTALGSNLISDSGEQNREPSLYFETSRMAVVRKAWQSQFPKYPRIADILSHPIRKSSVRDYERKWSKFISFLEDEGVSPTNISLSDVMGFFVFLFDKKKLKPGTVSHYRSAIAVPLRIAYNIDLQDPAVSTLLRGMYIQRPNSPISAPTWSLNRTLQYLDGLQPPATLEVLMQKTAFLLLLATGFRVSELHACVRDTSLCSFTGASTLRLRPHPNFLAKNECPKKRWSHKVIKSLVLPDGSTSNLCPVKGLQEYLWRTPRKRKGNIFLHPSTQEPLTVHQLSMAVCKVVFAAEPGAKASVHDVRRYASSQALMETMDVTEVTSAINWKSPHTFYRFYMAPMEPLSIEASLPSLGSSN